ncbi:MAG TPA: hypothetical protein VF403_24725, partial [Kofleriaceae bacterium]
MRWWLLLVCAACGRLEFDAEQVDAATIIDDPIGYWPFDEGGGTTALDASGHGNGGMLTAMVTRVPGHLGCALWFTGASNEEVDLGMPAALEPTGSMSLAAWIAASAFHLNNGTDDL